MTRMQMIFFLKILANSGLEVVRRVLYGVGLMEQFGAWSFGILTSLVEMDLAQKFSEVVLGMISHVDHIEGLLYAREVCM